MDIAKHWKTIFDTLQDGLIVVDPGGKIMAVNPSAERLTGFERKELVGKSCRILNCTGCKITKQPGELNWCGLFKREGIKVKKCVITDREKRPINILKSASVLKDERGKIIGAVETLTDMSEIVRKQQEIETLRKTYSLDDGFHGIIGKTPEMQNLFGIIENVAMSDAPVLIHGESGTGKELIARAIHELGGRRKKPYIKVNCAALNENLLESELFGHVKGAFTGANQTRIGRFEAAHGGTIFLDEIGDIPLATQVKLLRVLEDRMVERVGEHTSIPVDVRIITATNRNLDELIREGLFREDFYFRINVFPIRSPSLIERKDDIPLITQHFIGQNVAKSGKHITGISPEAMDAIMAFPWPGNVRELRNAVEYAFVLCKEGEIQPIHLPGKIVSSRECVPLETGESGSRLSEKEELVRVLRQSEGNQSEAARVLGVSRVTVWKRIKKYNIDLPTLIYEAAHEKQE